MIHNKIRDIGKGLAYTNSPERASKTWKVEGELTWTQESVGGQARCDRKHRGSEESIQLIRQYIPPLQSVAMLAMLEPEVHNVASSISTTIRQRHDFGT